jgi:hypothetical protein
MHVRHSGLAAGLAWAGPTTRFRLRRRRSGTTRRLRITTAASAAAFSAKSARPALTRRIAAVLWSLPSLLRARIWAAISRARRPAARRRSVTLVPVAPPAACTRRTVRTSLTTRLGQQPHIGRVRHVRRDHRGIGPHPGGAQQLACGGLGPHCLIESGHRLLAAPAGQLHQRGRMRHLPIPARSGKTAAS